MTGNWIYAYEDIGGCGNVITIERTPGEIMQETHESKVI